MKELKKESICVGKTFLVNKKVVMITQVFTEDDITFGTVNLSTGVTISGFPSLKSLADALFPEVLPIRINIDKV